MAAANLNGELEQARADNDEPAMARVLQQQQQNAFTSMAEVEMLGGDPATNVMPEASLVDPTVFSQYMSSSMERQQNKIVSIKGEAGYEFIDDLLTRARDEYKAANEEPLQFWHPNLSDEEKIKLQRQMQPVTMDPNEVAEARHRFNQFAMTLKTETGIDAYTDGRFKRERDWLLREQGMGGQAAYLESGEQEVGLAGKVAGKALTVTGAATDWMINVGATTTSGVHAAWLTLSGQDPTQVWAPPTQYVAAGGQVYNNGGRFGMVELFATTKAAITRSNIEEEIARTGLAQQWEKAQQSGIEQVIDGVGWFAGSVAGFAVPGAAMHMGGQIVSNGSMKGLQWLSKHGVTAANGQRAGAITRIMGKTSGAAAANGLAMAAAYGHADGLNKAFTHGAVMAPVLMSLGWMGRKTELWGRKKMPAQLAKYVGAAVEGAGFGAIDQRSMDHLWQFMKDPTETNWGEWGKVMAMNVVGSMTAKAAFGHRATEVLTGEERLGVPRETILERQALEGELEQVRGVDPKRAAEVVGRLGEIDQEMATIQAGLERSEAERQAESFALEELVAREGEAPPEVRQGLAERVSELKKVGRRLRERGGVEAALEARGRQVPRQGELALGREGSLIGRLQEGAQRREAADRPKTEVGAVVGAGPTKFGAGREKEVDLDALVKELGAEAREVATVHTHPTPSPASLADIAKFARKTQKTGESPPDYIVTPETVYEIKVAEQKEPMSLADLKRSGERRAKLIGAAANRIARKHGLERYELGEIVRKFAGRKELTANEKAAAREMHEAHAEVMKALAKEMGLEVREVSTEEANARLAEIERGAQEGMPSRLAEGGRGNREFPAAGDAEFEAPRTKERIKASEIITELEGRRGQKGIRIPFTEKRLFAREGDPIQVPIRKKGFQQKGIRGYFETRQDLIRTQEAYDLNNAAHEWAHAMQKNTVGFGWKPTSPEATAELMKLAEPMSTPNMNKRQRIAEGWAEFWARDLLGDADLMVNHPNLHRELMQWMAAPANNRLADQYGRIREAYRVWREQGAVARAMGEIEEGPLAKAKVGDPLLTKVEKTLGKLVDDAAMFRRRLQEVFERAGVEAEDLPINLRPDKVMDALRMTSRKRAEHMLTKEMTDFAGRRTGESLQEALEAIKAGEEMEFWAYMKRHRELEMMQKGLETGVSEQDALAAIASLERPHFKQAADKMRTWFHRLIDVVAEAGGFTPGEATSVKDAYMFYIPFHRMVEGPGGRGAPGRQRVTTGMKRVKGGTEPILNPREAITRMTASLLNRAQQAYAMKALYNDYLFLEGVGELVTVVDRDMVPTSHPMKQVVEALGRQVELKGDEQHQLESVLDKIAEGDFEALTLFSQATTPPGGRPIIAFTPKHTEAEIQRMLDLKESMGATAAEVKALEQRIRGEQGRLQWLEVDKDAFEVMQSLDVSPHMLSNLIPPVAQSLIMTPSRALRYFATGINPFFWYRNFIRDPLAFSLYSKNASALPFSGFFHFFKGLGLAMRGRLKDYKGDLFAAMGGKAATFIGLEIERGLNTVRIEGDPVSLTEKLRTPFRVMEEVGNLIEQALRHTEFEATRKRLLEEGASELEANLEALLDAKEVTINFTRASAVSRGFNSVKAYFNAGLQGNRKFLRTTLGYEGAKAQDHAIKAGMANLTAMSALMYLLMGDDDDWYKDLPEWQKVGYWNFKIGGTPIRLPKPHEPGMIFTVPFEKAMDELLEKNPVEAKKALFDIAGGFLNNYQILPDIIAPGLEATMNFSLFRQRPIVPHWMQKTRRVEDQFTAYTSKAARWIGDMVGVSPAKAEHVLNGYSGNAFLNLTRSYEGMIQFGKMPHQSSRAVDELLQLNAELEQASGSERAGLSKMTRQEKRSQPRVTAAARKVKALLRQAREGKMSREDAYRRAYQIAAPALERNR